MLRRNCDARHECRVPRACGRYSSATIQWGFRHTHTRVSEVLLITWTLIWALIAASDPNEGSPVYTPQAPGEEDAELVRARCNESNQFVPHYLSDKPERAC